MKVIDCMKYILYLLSFSVIFLPQSNAQNWNFQGFNPYAQQTFGFNPPQITDMDPAHIDISLRTGMHVIPMQSFTMVNMKCYDIITICMPFNYCAFQLYRGIKGTVWNEICLLGLFSEKLPF